MNIKAQDILVVLKWLASGWPGSFALLGRETGLSASEAHAAVQRARRAGLLHMLTDDRDRVPVRNVTAAELDVIQQHAPRSRQRQAVELVIGDEMRDVVALI